MRDSDTSGVLGLVLGIVDHISECFSIILV
jgi:hypothetical protein